MDTGKIILNEERGLHKVSVWNKIKKKYKTERKRESTNKNVIKNG